MICVEVHSNNVLAVRNDTFANAVSDSIKHETVKFLFSDNWKDYQKTAVFSAEGVEPINIVLSGENKLCVAEDECYIPFEVLKGDSFLLSVFGVKGESLATTTKEEIAVFTSGYALGDGPQTPTENEYSQILDIMARTQEIAQSVRDDADSGLFKGEKGEKGEKGDAGAGVGEATEQGGEIFNDYDNNKALGKFSHSSGINTKASKDGQFVLGYYNDNKEDTVFEVGNGTSDNRSNAFEVYKDGHAEVMSMGTNPTGNTVATKQYVDEEISTLNLVKVVNSLPTTGVVNKIYLIPSESAQDNNLFDEYIWLGDKWEYIGTRPIEIDMTQYYLKSQVDTLLGDLQNEINNSWQKNYPVGSIYLTPDETTNPSVLFGGVWVRQTVKATYHGTTHMFPNGASAGDNEEINVDIPLSVNISTPRFQLTCHTGGPQARSVSTIGTTYDTNGYLTKFVIKAYTSSVVGAGGTPIYYMVAGDSPKDDNGYYHWKRKE